VGDSPAPVFSKSDERPEINTLKKERTKKKKDVRINHPENEIKMAQFKYNSRQSESEINCRFNIIARINTIRTDNQDTQSNKDKTIRQRHSLEPVL
jgi:hypothetical protein